MKTENIGIESDRLSDIFNICGDSLQEAFTISTLKQSPAEAAEIVKKEAKKVLHHTIQKVSANDNPMGDGEREIHRVHADGKIHIFMNINDSENDTRYRKNGAKSTYQIRKAGKMDKPKTPNFGKVNEDTVTESTNSFKKLMRSIQDKKSIKNLKVPSASERNSDGTLKEPEKKEIKEMFANRDSGASDKENKAREKAREKARATAAMPWHKVMATVSNPAHAAVSKRDEKIQRSVKIRSNSPAEAKTKAKAFYKKQGYKVHDVEYHSKINEDFDFDAHQAMANRSNPVKRGKFKLVKNGQHISHHETESAAMTAWSSMKDNLGVKIVKEEQELSEALYKVSHKGHPSIKKSDGNLLFPITDGKTEYINHMTRYPKSAEDTAKLLKNKGFKDVQVHKDGKLMEENDLEEGLKPEHNLRPGWMLKQDPELAKKFKDKKDALKALRYDKPNPNHPRSLDESFNAEKKWPHGGSVMIGVNPRASKLPRYTVLFDPNKDPKRLTRGGLKTREISHHEDESEAKNAADAYATKFGYQRMKPIGESINLEESKMSELHATIGDHMDKHIATYKKIGGAESLMNHAEKAVPKIAKTHSIEHKHAEKFVSDYIDSKLNEETLDEVSGALLGRYIQAARKDKSAKIEHGKELDTDPKVKELRAKISDYYSRKEYKKSGESKHRDAINKAHDNIEKRKKKIDTDYPKSVNYWKRGKGIETAINKLKSGNLSEDTLNEIISNSDPRN